MEIIYQTIAPEQVTNCKIWWPEVLDNVFFEKKPAKKFWISYFNQPAKSGWVLVDDDGTESDVYYSAEDIIEKGNGTLKYKFAVSLEGEPINAYFERITRVEINLKNLKSMDVFFEREEEAKEFYWYIQQKIRSKEHIEVEYWFEDYEIKTIRTR